MHNKEKTAPHRTEQKWRLLTRDNEATKLERDRTDLIKTRLTRRVVVVDSFRCKGVCECDVFTYLTAKPDTSRRSIMGDRSCEYSSCDDVAFLVQYLRSMVVFIAMTIATRLFLE